MINQICSFLNSINCCKKQLKKQNYYYILELMDKKWYVGRTKNLDRRVKEHKTGIGSQWTKLYPVISLHKYMVSNSNFEEDMIVKEYMSKYGVENVRGGTYSTVQLEENTKKIINKEIVHANNLCFKCGKSGHYIGNCVERKKKEEEYVIKFGKYKGQKLEDVVRDLKYVSWMRRIEKPNKDMKELLNKIDE